jgi:hypothetical protein
MGMHRKARVRDKGVLPGMVLPIMAPKRGVYAKDKSEGRNWKLGALARILDSGKAFAES